MDCLLPAVLLALSGGPAADPRWIHPPVGVGVVPVPPPPGSAKPTYGTDLDHTIDTPNFTVQWSSEDVASPRAQAIADQLEAAWQALIVEQGWPVPVSADRYRLWVILDPAMEGSGFTTEYTTPDYPDGYPVMYVNPDYERDRPNYALSVAVHELGHAIQFAVRQGGADPAESWDWEASAEWMAERGAPELDTYSLSTWWYAQDPTVAFDSAALGHPYGMLIVNAWLEEAGPGDAFQAAWTEQAGEPWDEVLAAVSGRPFEEVIVQTSGAYGAEALRESADYYPPTWGRLDGPGEQTGTARLGTWYYEVPDGLDSLVLSGDAAYTFVTDGDWGSDPPEGAYRIAVTSTVDGGSFAWDFVAPEVVAGCGCGSGARGGWAAAALAIAATSRRRGRATPR